MNAIEDECCPEFHPQQWDGKTHVWKNKAFIRETIPTFFHIPFPPMIGSAIRRMWSTAEDAGQTYADKSDTLVLFYDPSPFRSELYLSVTGPVPEHCNAVLSGTFISRVFDGPYNAVPKFIKEMDAYLDRKGKKASGYYVHYAYCPGCAKKHGHNHMILFARVA